MKPKIFNNQNKWVTCITINTDASFRPDYRVGGFAFYIVCDYFKIRKGGIFKSQQPQNAQEAEMMCMANAIHTLLAQKDLPQTQLIVVNSDAITTFQHIKNKSTNPIGKAVAAQLRRIRKYMIKSVKIEFRHVKAHTKDTAARSKANAWCDQEAKRWMRIAVEQKKKEALERQNILNNTTPINSPTND